MFSSIWSFAVVHRVLSNLRSICIFFSVSWLNIVAWRFHRLTHFRASFLGTRVILRQVSPESELIYDFIITLYQSCGGQWPKLAQEVGVSEEDLQSFLQYAAQFLGNCGNYKGFGDSKFIPRCPPETLDRLALKSPEAQKILEEITRGPTGIYATEKPSLMHLGFPDKGHLSTYYPDSPNIQQIDIEEIGTFASEKKLLPENTRLRKLEDGNFEILIASGISNPSMEERDAGQDVTFDLSGRLEGRKLTLKFGDHREEMAKIALHIKKAGLNAGNDTQKRMMDEYAKSFGNGSLNAFRESQKLWVKDIGPEVETNIGFIESYRDPAGVRAEWEGFGA